MSLKNKVVVVTGGSRDIGKAVSLKMGGAGARVVVNYFNNQQQGEDTVAEIEKAGGTAIAVAGDMTKLADVERLVEETVKAFGDRIDVLANVVGGLVERKSLAEMDEDFFDYVMKLNVTSAFLTTKSVVPHMTDGGSIINFSSLAGRDGGGPGAAAYATSKGALMTFTRALAKELGPHIAINCVCPGLIKTELTMKNPVIAEREPELVKGIALGRCGSVQDVAGLVAYLATTEPNFITGQDITIDGFQWNR